MGARKKFTSKVPARYTCWAIVIWLALVTVMMTASWVTHIIVSIQTEAWLLLLAGALLFPVGIMHGLLVMLGIV